MGIFINSESEYIDPDRTPPHIKYRNNNLNVAHYIDIMFFEIEKSFEILVTMMAIVIGILN